MQSKPAYTLIELTIVVGLVSLLSIAIASAVLINTLTAHRTQNLTHLRRTGEYTLNTFKQLIRSARFITTCNSANNLIEIQNQDGGVTTLSLELDNTNYRLASNSGIYLSSADTNITNFNLTCLPNDTNPNLIQLSFDIQLNNSDNTRENPKLHFTTSVNPRSN